MTSMALDTAADFVVSYLNAMEARDFDVARTYVGDTVEISFPGGREFRDITEITKNSESRYNIVRKKILRRDAWQESEKICVLITGVLYGEWPNGQAFDNIRFADRFEIGQGKITKQEVWNDAAERVLAIQRDGKQ